MKCKKCIELKAANKGYIKEIEYQYKRYRTVKQAIVKLIGLLDTQGGKVLDWLDKL